MLQQPRDERMLIQDIAEDERPMDADQANPVR